MLTIDVNEREENQSYHVEKRKQVIDKIIQFYNESDDFEVKYINLIIILGLRQYYRNTVRFDREKYFDRQFLRNDTAHFTKP